MLTTLREVARRGKPIVVFNPMRERGLERFQSPKDAGEMLTGGATDLVDALFPAAHRLRLPGAAGPDEAPAGAGGRARAACSTRSSLPRTRPGSMSCARSSPRSTGRQLCAGTGLSREEFDTAAGIYAAARSVIVAYGMGITQHRHGTGNVQQIANLLLLRGNMGRPGAGICPVRGHSNVQGDRTVGINERPPADFLDRLDAAFGIRCAACARRDGGRVHRGDRAGRHPRADFPRRQLRRGGARSASRPTRRSAGSSSWSGFTPSSTAATCCTRATR